MEFVNKEYFLLLLLLIPYIWCYFRFRRKVEPTMRMSDTTKYIKAPKSWRMRMVHAPMVLRCLTLALIITAMARPQTKNGNKFDKPTDGIDIMLALDVSSSMLANDLEPCRFDAAKAVANEFIADRENDNIGLVIFAGEAFTQCPLTTDHASLLSLLQSVRSDMALQGLIPDGTAIGTGLATSVSRLKESKSKSRVVILLTDGSNNAGEISPYDAADMAKTFGVRIYTIGVGSNGTAVCPVPTPFGIQYTQVRTEIDEKTLYDIASNAGGKYYRATNNEELKRIYSDIDKLEKSRIDGKKYAKRYEAFAPFAIMALLTLLLEVLLRTVVLRRIP